MLRRDRFCMCKSGRKTHEGPRPLNPAIESLTIGRLHALCKILPAMLGAAFDLVCSLRPLPLCGGVSEVRLLGKRIAQVKCTQSCTAAGTKAPPCGLPINRSAERCRPAARGAAG